MKIKMELLSDVIFGDGMSVPGAEDISVLHDEYGFPYYKGGTFKGVFREELKRYLQWTGNSDVKAEIQRLLGDGDVEISADQLIFTDFQISENIRWEVLKETGRQRALILELFTHLRTFTALEEDHVKEGSLRMARCVNKGIFLYSEILCPKKEDEKTVKEVLGMMKWIGSMRNRGFGKVKISEEELK